MIRVDHAIDGGQSPAPEAALLLTVHDELVFELPTAGVEDFKRWVKGEMEAVYKLAVPLVVDVGSGATWGDAH
jgi:DNA polymerase-1